MFTGIVTDVGEVVSLAAHGALKRIEIACSYPLDEIALGASIANAGICLTVTALRHENARTIFSIDASNETLSRTTLGDWRFGRRVNLERSLKMGDELGGHLVSGHVDGVAEILERQDRDGTARFTLRAPKALEKFIAEKGSVALDGTSLTVNEVAGDTFTVMLIPHTLKMTTWGGVAPSDLVNLEVDLMARYAARLAEAGGAG